MSTLSTGENSHVTFPNKLQKLGTQHKKNITSDIDARKAVKRQVKLDSTKHTESTNGRKTQRSEGKRTKSLRKTDTAEEGKGKNV